MWLLVNNIHAKNLTCFFSFTCHRLSPFPVPAYKWQTRPRLVKILTGEYWWIAARNLFPENWSRLSFYVFITFHVFPLLPGKKTTAIIKIPLLCSVNLGFGRGKRRNGGYIDGHFLPPAGISPEAKSRGGTLVTRAYITDSTYSSNIQSVY